MRVRHWQDIASLAVGVWLLVSPWALGLSGVAAVMTAVLGAAVVLFAVEGLWLPSYLEAWCEGGVGLVLVLLPWLTGFADQALASRNSVLAGLCVLLFAVWEMVDDPELQSRWQAWQRTHLPH